MSRLQEKLDEINRQKQTYLKPENIRQGITAFGVEGQMTSENMWQPIYSNQGDYYILSFVNLEGNSLVNTVYGYGGFRVVKFDNDNRWYLFDVRMNKPKQLSNEIHAYCRILSYTDEAVWLITDNGTENGDPLIVYKYDLVTNELSELTKLNHGWYMNLGSEERGIYVRDNLIWGAYNSSGSYVFSAIYKFNTNNNTLTKIHQSNNTSTPPYRKGTNAVSSDTNASIYVYGDYAFFLYGGSTLSRYRISTGTFTQTFLSGQSVCHGLSNNQMYLFKNSDVYQFDQNNGIGAKLDAPSTPFGSTQACLIWINDNICIFNKQLYNFDEATLTFTKIVNTTFTYPKISSTYLDVIIGYSFLGINYYFNVGNPIISHDKIVAGYFARDQYNQVVQGTLANQGNLIIKPSTSQQVFPESYASSIVVNPVTYEIDADIKPENIRYGVNILGVAGTLEQDAAESVMSQEEYDACVNVADAILGI